MEEDQPDGLARVDFFISYTSADEAWATWVAEVLETEGRTVAVQAWDSPTGENFVLWIKLRMDTAARTIALCSPAYFDSHWCTQEWTAALAGRKLIPLRVADCTIPTVLATIGYRDLHRLDEATARRRLLEATALVPVARVSTGFPGSFTPPPAPVTGTAFPGQLPTVFTVPARNRYFTGRATLLGQLRAGLADGVSIAVTALHGLGGVGKTQLAIEYAHRYAADYSLIGWIDAEQTDLIGEQLAALTPHLGLPTTGRIGDDAAAVLDWLRRHPGWLLIFDNANEPAGLRPWLPDGPGHILITSRYPGWGGLADRIDVDVLPRDEAVALLGRRIPGIGPTIADQLADDLGDLPLALEQVAAYLDTTGLAPADYLAKFRSRRAQMLTRGVDLVYGRTIDTVWSLALDRLRAHCPAAVAMLDLCAHFGPEPIPLALINDHPDLLGSPLHDVVAGTDPSADLDDILGAVLAYSLARRDSDTIQLHRLVAAVIRAHQPSALAESAASTVRALLAAHQPDGYRDPAGWPRWAVLAPQVLTAPALHPDSPAVDIGHDARQLLLTTAYYLDARGDSRAAGTLGRILHTRWSTALGDEHPDSLAAGYCIAAAYRLRGNYQAARVLNEDTLTHLRRVLGDDHPNTLTSANNLAADLHALGDLQSARELNEDTLARSRRVSGDDHPNTLRSANNLALDLHALGDHQAARTLNEDTLAHRRRILGDDHPNTLGSANNLALDLRMLGNYQ
ncbi:FxSxx-COOH system tetratricopeptide repeat protein, partial [Frankia sp. CiP3]|uniref:FxSxx-COOH system tetratricopeptide repeat protein n=1 Tax=Frankia sp. CiP3 TaxID=2880971 RepID=UPI001EF61AD7